MRTLLFFLFIFFSILPIDAQDLSGTWEGSSTNSASYMKLVLIRQGNNYIGYSYDDGDGFCKANFAGNFDEEKQLLTGEGISFISRSPDHSLMRFRLKYEKKAGADYLQGTTGSPAFFDKLLSMGFLEKVILKRTDLKADTTLFMRERLLQKIPAQQKDTLAAENITKTGLPPINQTGKLATGIFVAKEKRSVDTLSTIVTPEKIITISVFDNGLVDGDTVTIFHNNQVLLSNHFVSSVPYKITLLINKEQPRHEIMLVANNLGHIPPNTAVLTIEAGDQYYRLTASADLSKNALVIFEYKE